MLTLRLLLFSQLALKCKISLKDLKSHVISYTKAPLGFRCLVMWEGVKGTPTWAQGWGEQKPGPRV